MRPIFIVTDETADPRIISASALCADIRRVFVERDITDYKRCDVESLCEDVVNVNSGKSIPSEEYAQMVNQYVYALQEYHKLTPYRYLTEVIEQRTGEPVGEVPA